jgi:predicted DsbA family dithiol-disulfide isomerase
VRIHDQLAGISVSAIRVAVSVDLIEFDLFYDYSCPFVYRASKLIEEVRRSGARNVEVGWRYFSLSQVNSTTDGWTIWAAPESEPVRGRLAFKAAEAARRQHLFDDFHMALLNARHRDRLDLEDGTTVERIADESGLDLDAFRHDLSDPTILEGLARDHQEGRAKHGVFGTPTFVFPDGAAAYVRLTDVPAADDAARVFDQVVAVTAREPGILEIKRPRKPTPD